MSTLRTSDDSRFAVVTACAEEDVDRFAEDVRAGLGATPKSLPCRYLYDKRGSELFERICDVPEYYPTRVERDILQQNAPEIADLLPVPVTVVELGSGSAVKTRVLLDSVLARQARLRYVPIDVSRSALEGSGEGLTQRFDRLDITAFEGDYAAGLQYAHDDIAMRKLILWLGSSVGNFERDEAASFLCQVSSAMTDDDLLLVGIDLRKDRRTLERAYNDAAGVSAQFNENILRRINRELGGNFDADRFRHVAVYDREAGKVGMYLVSDEQHEVTIERLGLTVAFDVDESIHTENSHKYSLEEIDELAGSAGLETARRWLDADGLFSLNMFRRANGRAASARPHP